MYDFSTCHCKSLFPTINSRNGGKFDLTNTFSHLDTITPHMTTQDIDNTHLTNDDKKKVVQNIVDE
jgi:hypothetical protein